MCAIYNQAEAGIEVIFFQRMNLGTLEVAFYWMRSISILCKTTNGSSQTSKRYKTYDKKQTKEKRPLDIKGALQRVS